MGKAAGLCLVGGVLLALLLVGGCGGHDGQVPPGGGGGGPVGATFVGRAVCVVCHDGPGNAYASSPHGLDFHNVNGMDLINGSGGACAPCHVTGFGETGGWVSSTATPQLDGISCEECHGRGSEHAGQPSTSNITIEPQADQTCWDCHVASYKQLRSGPPAVVTDANFLASAPSRVGPHHAQTPFLLGYLGFNRPQMAGPHAQVNNTCVTCHLSPNSTRWHGATGLAVDYDACVACHGSQAAAQAMVEEVQNETKTALIEIGGADASDPTMPSSAADGGLLEAYRVAHNITTTTNASPNDPYVQRYKAARWNYIYIETSSAFGAHNIDFTEQLIEDTKALLTQ